MGIRFALVRSSPKHSQTRSLDDSSSTDLGVKEGALHGELQSQRYAGLELI